MNENFQRCLKVTLKEEGGLADDPHDPGGRTFQGVTQRNYDHYRHAHGRSLQDVAHMPQWERNSIYWTEYWLASGCATLPSGMDMSVFDAAVNSGSSRAIHWWNEVKHFDSVADTIDHYAGSRLAFLKSLRNWYYFGNDWGRRVENIRRVSHEMASVGPEPTASMVQPVVAALAKRGRPRKKKVV